MLPLKGIRVLDLTTINPFTGTEFSDYGAEVIKVERPGMGDTLREYPPMKDGVSLFHAYTDRGKKSITLNIKNPNGQAALKELVKHADVLIENFKVGTMEKLGLGFEDLSKVNPKLVYGKLSSFGNFGPKKDFIAYDIAMQSQCGVMDATGFPDGEPSRVGAFISDHLSCTYMGSAVIMALYHAKKTGIGQRVESSMFESLMSLLEDGAVRHAFSEGGTTRTGNLHVATNPCDIIVCKDGYVTLAVTTDAEWVSFCNAFGKPDWATDAKYSTNEQRGKHYIGDLRDKLETLFVGLGKHEIEATCVKADVPASAVNTVEETIAEKQITEREMIPTVVDQRLGDVLTIGKSIKYGDFKGSDTFTTAPLLGAHNDEIYGEIYSKAEIAELLNEGAI